MLRLQLHLKALAALSAALFLFNWQALAQPAEGGAQTALCCDASKGKAPCEQPKYGPSRVALIVGTDDYSSFGTALDPLKNARNDARALAQTLHDQGVSVRCILDPSRDIVTAEISDLVAHLFRRQNQGGLPSRDGHAFLYFAGHGFNEGGTDYLIFRSDEKPDEKRTLDSMLEDTRYAVPGILRPFNGLKTYMVTAVFDACRSLVRTSGPGQPPSFRGTSFANSSDQLQQDNFQTQKLVVYSTFRQGLSIDAAPQELERANGLYASHLKYFINLRDLSLHAILSATSLFVSHDASKMNQIQQPQTVDMSAVRANVAWRESRSPNACAMVAAKLWSTAFSCLSPLGNDACRQELCGKWEEIASIEPPSSSEIECIKASTKRLPYRLPEVCSSQAADSITANRTTRLVQINNSPTGQIGLEAFVQASAQATSTTLTKSLDQALTEAMTVSSKKQVADQLRPVWLKPISTRADVTAVTLAAETRGTVQVKTLPNEAATTVLPLPPGSKVQIDCRSIQCREGWAGVRLAAAAPTRGFIRTADLQPVAETVTIETNFEDGFITLSEEALTRLRSAIQKQGTPSELSAVLVVNELEGTSRYDALLAQARLSHLSSVLTGFGLLSPNIVTTVAQTSEGDHLSSYVKLTKSVGASRIAKTRGDEEIARSR